MNNLKNSIIYFRGDFMAYTALYREWRPKTFGDVVGQKHISETLKNQIISNRIAHAYLFCGTRGTGKTSTAKIMAKAVNCLNLKDGEPCNECEMCKKINAGNAIDVIEIDAASNNGVDNIRDIKDDVNYPPHEAKYKVYIIDEVHMLSIGAVNAFLKTLEEPPKNVIFILATTDPQKLPVTILSRCQRFDFKRIKAHDIQERLRKIAGSEGVYADDRSLGLISRMADGAMRDALSIFDEAISMGNGKVQYDDIINMLGLVTNEYLFKITDAVIEKDVEKSLRIIDDIVMSGKDTNNFIKDFITHFRNLMMAKISDNDEEIFDMSDENIHLLKEQSKKIRIEEIMRDIRILSDALEQSKWSKQSRIYLEISVIKMCKIEYDTSNEVILSRFNKMEEKVKSGEISVLKEQKTDKIDDNVDKEDTIVESDVIKKTETAEVKNENPIEENPDSKVTLEAVQKSFKDILEILKSRRYMVLYASLMTGKVISVKNGVIEIFYTKDFAFNKKRLEREENRKVIETVFSEALKEKVGVKYTVENDEKKPEEKIIEAFGRDSVEIRDE